MVRSLTFGDDTERAFRTDEEPTKIRSNGRFSAGRGCKPGRISGFAVPPGTGSLGSLASLDHFAVWKDHSQAGRMDGPQEGGQHLGEKGAFVSKLRQTYLRTLSRMVPYRTAFVPEAPVPIMPPICAPGAGSTGKKSGIPRSFSSAFRASYDTPGCTTASRSCSVGRERVFQQRVLRI